MDFVDNLPPIQVYLRLKSASDTDQKACFIRQNEQEIVTDPPCNSISTTTASNGRTVPTLTHESFSFSHIFDVDATQEEIFQKVVLEPLEQFSNGINALLFFYGANGAGKSYTVKGNNQSIGVIPRALDVLFNSVTVDTSLNYVPCDYTIYKQTTNSVRAAILKNKTDLLNQARKSEKVSSSSISRDSDGLNLHPCISREQEVKASIALQQHPGETVSVALFVSFVEIFNENIFDLLLLPTSTSVSSASISSNSILSPSISSSRPSLEIRTNKNGNAFLKGVTYVPVFSAEEACALLRLGLRNQQTAPTRLHQSTLRSHTIFSIVGIRRVMIPRLDDVASDATDTDVTEMLSHCAPPVQVSEFHFCNLASNERIEKVDASDMGLYEAKQINSTMWTLKRCIDMLREIQMNPESNAVVPYRDSKLTRLLQMFFTGHSGRVHILANISLDSQLFPESVGTLKFAAIAHTVLEEVKESKLDTIDESSITQLETNSLPMVRCTQLSMSHRATASLSETAFSGIRSNKVAPAMHELQLKKAYLEKELLKKQEFLKEMETQHLEEVRRVTEEFHMSSNRRVRIFTDAAIKDTEEEYVKKKESLQHRMEELLLEVGEQRSTIDQLQRRNEDIHMKQRQWKHRCSILPSPVDDEALKMEDLKVTIKAKLSKLEKKFEESILNLHSRCDNIVQKCAWLQAMIPLANQKLQQHIDQLDQRYSQLMQEKTQRRNHIEAFRAQKQALEAENVLLEQKLHFLERQTTAGSVNALDSENALNTTLHQRSMRLRSKK